MGKATRVKRENARERIAAQRAAQRKREMRNRMLWTGGAILGVIVIVVAFVLVKTTQSPTPTNTAGADSATGTALPASVVKDITTVPPSTLTSVGTGTADPKSITTVASAKALTSGGKPQVLYIGAEYCPYCATERWAMAVALSRFGTFSGLHGIHSSSSDVYPSTPTLTFYKSTYTSKYLTFTPVETQTEKEGTALQKPTAAAERAAGQVRQPAVRGLGRHGRHPVHRLRRQVLRARRPVQPADPVGPVVGPGGRRAQGPVQRDRQGRGRRGQHDHRDDLQDHE